MAVQESIMGRIYGHIGHTMFYAKLCRKQGLFPEKGVYARSTAANDIFLAGYALPSCAA